MLCPQPPIILAAILVVLLLIAAVVARRGRDSFASNNAHHLSEVTCPTAGFRAFGGGYFGPNHGRITSREESFRSLDTERENWA